MGIEQKIDKIFSGIGDLKTDIKVLAESVSKIDDRGCKGGHEAIKELKDDIAWSKRIAYIGTVVSTAIASSIGYLSGHR